MGVGFDDGLKEKLNFPDGPADCGDAVLGAVGLDDDPEASFSFFESEPSLGASSPRCPALAAASLRSLLGCASVVVLGRRLLPSSGTCPGFPGPHCGGPDPRNPPRVVAKDPPLKEPPRWLPR